MKPTIGQKVILRATHTRNQTVREGTIIRIGRVYYYVDIGYNEIAFTLDGHRQKDTGYGYGYDWELFFSEQEMSDVDEQHELRTKLREVFMTHRKDKRLTLENLRKIDEILRGANDEHEG